MDSKLLTPCYRATAAALVALALCATESRASIANLATGLSGSETQQAVSGYGPGANTGFGLSANDFLQTSYNAGAGPTTITGGAPLFGSLAGLADAPSAANAGNVYGSGADSTSNVNAVVVFDFTNPYARTLDSILVEVAGATDTRRFYDFDLAYRSSAAGAFANFATASSFSVSNSNASNIVISGLGHLGTVEAIRLTAREQNVEGYYRSTAFNEVDITVPEPTSLALLGIGTLWLLSQQRRVTRAWNSKDEISIPK